MLSLISKQFGYCTHEKYKWNKTVFDVHLRIMSNIKFNAFMLVHDRSFLNGLGLCFIFRKCLAPFTKSTTICIRTSKLKPTQHYKCTLLYKKTELQCVPC